MYRTALIAGGIFAALGIYDATTSVAQWTAAHAQRLLAPGPAVATTGVDRSRKGDRLPLLKAAREGAGTEVSNPLAANVTVVAKGVRLPEIPLRDRRPDVAPPPPAANPAPRLVGCDPLASPLAGSSVQHLTGRCIAAADRGVRVASR
jgi:hypothetical protein